MTFNALTTPISAPDVFTRAGNNVQFANKRNYQQMAVMAQQQQLQQQQQFTNNHNNFNHHQNHNSHNNHHFAQPYYKKPRYQQQHQYQRQYQSHGRGQQPQQQYRRRRRQLYPNDAGLTDQQYMTIIEGRTHETPESLTKYLHARKSNYPTADNLALKHKIIEAKVNRGQLLTVNEKILEFKTRTGYKNTPSALRFSGSSKPRKFNQNVLKEVLKTEITQENSAILQCFRFFVNRDFLNQPTMEVQNNNDNPKQSNIEEILEDDEDEDADENHQRAQRKEEILIQQ